MQTIPLEITKQIIEQVQKSHPLDFVTQLYVVEKQIEAYVKLQSISNPDLLAALRRAEACLEDVRSQSDALCAQFEQDHANISDVIAKAGGAR